MNARVASPAGEAGGVLEVALVQHDIHWEDREATLAHLTPLIADAATGGASLVVLTEMFSTGFSPDTARIAEPLDGPTVGYMLESASSHGLWVLGSVCISEGSGTAPPSNTALPSNTAVLVSPTGEVHTYAKRHLFSYSGEHDRITPGCDTLTVDIRGVRTSIFVCYDLRFADDFWALAPTTDAYVVVANWPTSRSGHWRALLVARAIENQAWVLGANRVGTGGGIDYGGDSLVVDPSGVIVADGSGGGEEVLRATVTEREVARVRSRYPFLADRRNG